VPHDNIGIDRSVSAARSTPAFCLLAEEIVPSPFCAVGAVGSQSLPFGQGSAQGSYFAVSAAAPEALAPVAARLTRT
jgi:hypothetical protein